MLSLCLTYSKSWSQECSLEEFRPELRHPRAFPTDARDRTLQSERHGHHDGNETPWRITREVPVAVLLSTVCQWCRGKGGLEHEPVEGLLALCSRPDVFQRLLGRHFFQRRLSDDWLFGHLSNWKHISLWAWFPLGWHSWNPTMLEPSHCQWWAEDTEALWHVKGHLVREWQSLD